LSRDGNNVSGHSTQTDAASLLHEEGINSSSNSSPDYPVEGESAYLAFVGQHPNLILQADELPANTSGPKSASPQVVAAHLVTNQEQFIQPEFASTHRASLPLPRVSVKSRIAAFENRSPTARTFGSSPSQPGKVTSVNHSFAPTTAESETTVVVPSPPAVFRKECTSLRGSPQSPLRVTVQTLTPSPDTEYQFLTPPPIDGSKLPEQSKTPRVGKESAIPIRSKSVGSERPFLELSRPQPRLQIPSFGWRFPPGEPLQRVKRNDLPGPSPRPEDALVRQNRYKPHSSLSQAFRPESSEEQSLELAPAEPTLSVDEDSSQLLPVSKGHPNIRRSSSTHQDCTATLRSLEVIEFAEEQPIFSRITESSLKEDCGRSTVSHSQTALVPKPFRPYRTTIARPEQVLSSVGFNYASYQRRGVDADHPNLSNFSFSFDTITGKDSNTFKEAQHKLERNSKPTLLPSPLSRLGYDDPPSTGELPNSEARTLESSVSALEGASVSDFERPSRRRAATSRSHTRHLLSFGPYTKPLSLGPPHQLHSFRPILFEDGSILPLESEIKLLRHRREQAQKETEHSNFCKAFPDQDLSTDSWSDSPPDSTENPTQGVPKAGAQHSEVSLSQEPEEFTPPITRSLIQDRLCLSDSESESDSDAMDRLRPESALAVSQHRREAMRLAKAQETSVIEKCRRSGASVPEYAFDELIGKGSFGRVYKW
jgi:hypothetical protein